MDFVYNADYYKNHCGTNYSDSIMESNLQIIAEQIIQDFHPKTVLDAGCAWGFLVAALRDRGVEAYGVDISEYAISKVRKDIQPYCVVGSLTEELPQPLPRRYDLVVTIEVLEHLYAEDGRTAIRNICSCSDTVLFTSSPDDYEEPTHVNVQKREYWARAFAQCGFQDNIFYRRNTLPAHAMLFQKNLDMLEVITNYEHYIRQNLDMEKSRRYGKVYFNFGSGESEKDSISFAVNSGKRFYEKIIIPEGCLSLRYDPVEGTGCLLSNLQIRSDNDILQAGRINGQAFDNLLLFSTIDPQIYIENIPTTAHWVEIEADVICQDSSAWLYLCRTIDQMDTDHRSNFAEMETKLQNAESENKKLSEDRTNARLRCRKLEDSEKKLAQEKAQLELRVKELEPSEFRCRELEYSVNQLIQEKTQLALRIKELKVSADSLKADNDEAKYRIAELENSESSLLKEIQDYTNLVEYERVESNRSLDELRNEIQEYSNLVAYERGEAKKVSDAYLCTINSTTWRMTKPVRLLLDAVKAIFFRPTARMIKLVGKTFRFMQTYGIRATLRKIKHKLRHNNENESQTAQIAYIPPSPEKRKMYSMITGNPIDPVTAVMVESGKLRLNLVTDTIDSSSLLGGVATALIVATEYANKIDCELRIITRNDDVNPRSYQSIMELNGIEPAKKVSFYSDFERHTRSIDYKLEISRNDIFFATSWWSAEAISKTTIRKRFFYIIQEVETFFYNYGGERLLCERVMNNRDIDFIVNSSYLYRYFEENESNIANNSCYFEPAFSTELYQKPQFIKKSKYKLFFYSRPNNPRNLYQVGVEFLNKAVDSGILNTDEWEIYCVGQDAPVITFSDGSKSINLGQLSWGEYAAFLSDVDLGLCLMYTPHPSYPPFDVACSGGVVLSNKMLNKTSLDMCKNIILSDLDENAFMKSFSDAEALARNIEQRKKNFEENTIPRNWHQTLAKTIDYMKEKSTSV